MLVPTVYNTGHRISPNPLLVIRSLSFTQRWRLTLKMEAALSSETFVSEHFTTRCHTPEDNFYLTPLLLNMKFCFVLNRCYLFHYSTLCSTNYQDKIGAWTSGLQTSGSGIVRIMNEGKRKLSLCLAKHHAMKWYGCVKVLLHAFLNSALRNYLLLQKLNVNVRFHKNTPLNHILRQLNPSDPKTPTLFP
jgi:hypothetical protein